MTLQTLVALGAPTLPPDHFYRVTTRSDFFARVEVEVRHRRPGRRFSSLVAESTVAVGDFDSGEAAVVFGCQRAVEKAEARRQTWRAFAEAEALAGDHS